MPLKLQVNSCLLLSLLHNCCRSCHCYHFKPASLIIVTRTKQAASFLEDTSGASLFVCLLTDVRAKIFHSIDFFKIVLRSDNESLVPELQTKLGVTVFVPDLQRVENYPDFDKLARVI